MSLSCCEVCQLAQPARQWSLPVIRARLPASYLAPMSYIRFHTTPSGPSLTLRASDREGGSCQGNMASSCRHACR
jgi:hypothetical protein